MTSLEEEYGSMTAKDLRKELKSRGAPLAGRKKDLIDRLIYWKKNDNFGSVKSEEGEVKVIVTPPPNLYKEINLSSPVPRLTDDHISEYLQLFEKINVGSAKGMYENGYLRFLKYCIQGGLYFVTSKCEAQMRKNITYNVNVSLEMDGEVRECTCECLGGGSIGAHCKHVCVTLYGVRDIFSKKPAILRQTTTDKLQSFHHPKKRYAGSPIKAKRMVSKRKKCKSVDPDESDDDDDPFYKNYFDNLIKSRGIGNDMTMKQLMDPANPYAVELDHDYLKYQSSYNLLRHLRLVDITLEGIERIELETLHQSNSAAWFMHRKFRITASKFYDVCKVLNKKQGRNMAPSILNPVQFKSRATAHGRLYEKEAIQLFEEEMLGGQMKCDYCGLLVMKQYPFLGASPDALLGELTVVEVKCPYSCRHAFANELTFNCLYKNESGDLCLKEDSAYHYQVQGQLLVTGRSYCDFVIFTFVSLVRISVPRNEKFISMMLSKLINFYKKYLKPVILEKILYKDYRSIFPEYFPNLFKSSR